MDLTGPFGDTSPEAVEAWREMLLSRTPDQRLATIMQLSGMALDLARDGIRHRHPGISERELLARLAATHLDRERVIKVYGWDPEAGVDGDWRSSVDPGSNER